jgi:RNA polymerase sigma-70 factor (ECF subfamily)
VTAGDPGDLAALYDRYARLVRSICFDRVRNLADAEDLAQEVFLRAYQRLDQLKCRDRVGNWLAAIARSTCQDWHRRRVRGKERSCGSLPEVESPLDHHDPSEIDALRLAICELPEKERLALHIHYLCEQPAEVARDILGMSSSGFYKLIERARRRLATIMKTQGIRP